MSLPGAKDAKKKSADQFMARASVDYQKIIEQIKNALANDTGTMQGAVQVNRYSEAAIKQAIETLKEQGYGVQLEGSPKDITNYYILTFWWHNA